MIVSGSNIAPSKSVFVESAVIYIFPVPESAPNKPETSIGIDDVPPKVSRGTT